MKKYLISVFVLIVIVTITIKNENLIFQNSSLSLDTKSLKKYIKVFLPRNKDDGRIELISYNEICATYIKDNIIFFREVNTRDDNLSHIFNVFSKKSDMADCNFNIIIFKRHPNPFIALFFVHLPIIIIFYLLIRIFLSIGVR